MTLTIRSVFEMAPEKPRAVRIHLLGSLDSATAADLETEVGRCLEGRPRLLVFDLSALKFISSAGIRILAHARKQMEAWGGLSVLYKPQPQIEKVIEIIRSLPGLSIFQDEQELDAYLAEIQQKVLDGELPGQS